MKITTAQRRARLGVRHFLAAPAATAEEMTDGVLALHGSDPATVHLSAWARLPASGPADLERALYDDRTLVRLLAMRRTMFVVTAAVAPLAQHGCSADVARRERAKAVKFLSQQGYPENVPDADRWYADVLDATAAALEARGSAFAQQLTEDVPRLKQQLRMSPGKPYEAIGAITSRVLTQLGLEGRIVRGRPRGSLISSQYSWAPVDRWLPGGIPPMSEDEAYAGLTRRWLRAFGPAPVTDLQWWTGWPLGRTRKALAAVGPVEVDLDGVPGLALADDLDPVPEPLPWVALLPGLDPTPMGWAARDWFLGPHRDPLFDRNGNIGPTVWSDGRVVGGWAQRATGEIVFRLLEDVGAETTAAIEAAAERLEGQLGEVRVTPRFRTPLERELAG